eukprot:scaffold1492_cov187-Skeletonema_menzelii.AAC.3
MSMPNSLSSSLSNQHPAAVWSATIANQSADATFFRRRINRHLRSSVPNWTRLSGGDHDVDSNHERQGQLLSSEHLDSQVQLAATYSTPQTASAAYNSGLLKSDDNIASNALRIHGKQKASGDERDNNIDDDDLLYLCWVRQDGIPCHFRKLVPVEKILNNSSKSKTKSRIRGGNTSTVQTDEVVEDVFIVNEHDVIESTFPGHAFVFCRRIANSDQLPNITDDNNGDDMNTSPRVIHDENGHTLFLRRQKKERSDDVESDESSISSSEEDTEIHKRNPGTKNEDINDCNNEGDDSEKYLVVGGFRPGPMPRSSSSSTLQRFAIWA